MKGKKHFDLAFCHDYLLTKPNICAEFERSCITSCLVLPGFLINTLLSCRICDFMYFGGQNKTKKEWFIIIKCDVESSAVSPFKYYFLLRELVKTTILEQDPLLG